MGYVIVLFSGGVKIRLKIVQQAVKDISSLISFISKTYSKELVIFLSRKRPLASRYSTAF